MLVFRDNFFLPLCSVILLICITKVAKASLDKALSGNAEIETVSILPIVAESPLDLHKPLIIKIDSVREDGEKQILT